MKSSSSGPSSRPKRKRGKAETSAAASSDDAANSSDSCRPRDGVTAKRSKRTSPTSGSGCSENAGRPAAVSPSPTQIGGLFSTLSSVRPSNSSKRDASNSRPKGSLTLTNGKSSGKGSGLAATAPSSSKRLSQTRRPSGTDVQDLKEVFQQKLYGLLMEPRTIQALRELLRTQDKDLRKRAWALMFEHVLPVSKEGVDGPGKINLFMNVPRPEQNITPVEG